MEADNAIRELRRRLDAIEDDVDNGRYRPGPWEALIRAVRARPSAERLQIAEGIGRVSRKLHMRAERRTIGIGNALALELVATLFGGLLLVLAIVFTSNVLAIIGAVIWVTTFQPLIKFGCGRAVGIRYDYAYLYGVEPRFKTDYGSYLASSRAARIVFHLSGTIGSPLAAWFIGSVLPPQMGLARMLCRYGMWILIATNVVTLLVGLVGVRRIGGFRLRDSSSGVAAAEMREGMGLQA